MSKGFILKRRLVQAIVGGLLFAAILYFKVSLLYILFAGVVTGIVFGKIFCRWMCPIGFVMEFLFGSGSDSKQQMYNYHKLGCPIAWISGFLNRFSLFKIKRDEDKCTDCGICDANCYISTINREYSLFRKNSKNPSAHFSCSRCLECVEKCPTNSLEYKV